MITPFNITNINMSTEASENYQNKMESWTKVIGDKDGEYPSGFGTPSNIATRGIAIYNDELFIGTQTVDIENITSFNVKNLMTIYLVIYRVFDQIGILNILLKISNLLSPIYGSSGVGCEAWKYNYATDEWKSIVGNSTESILPSGFGNKGNFAVSVMKKFNEKLYIGTAASTLYGCEIWRWDGTQLERVVKNGFGDRYNSGIWSIEIFNNELYIGTMNWKSGCQIWKTKEGNNWEKLSLLEGDGFGTIWNIYPWSMEVFNDSLYVGTCNVNQGSQLFRYNGENWEKTSLPNGDGFGEKLNYGIRNIVVYNNELYIATATSYMYDKEACELWKFNGKNWIQIIGENGELTDGFDNVNNKYAWSMIVTSNNRLIVGTSNLQPYNIHDPLVTNGCEIWSYNGTYWEKMVGENGSDGILGGFGSNYNIGARSMIEYPNDSGVIWVGTFNLDIINYEEFNGCEIWKREQRISQ